MRKGGRPSGPARGRGEPVMMRLPASSVQPWLSLEITSACDSKVQLESASEHDKCERRVKRLTMGKSIWLVLASWTRVPLTVHLIGRLWGSPSAAGETRVGPRGVHAAREE